MSCKMDHFCFPCELLWRCVVVLKALLEGESMDDLHKVDLLEFYLFHGFVSGVTLQEQIWDGSFFVFCGSSFPS